jgi:hypothetical protein
MCPSSRGTVNAVIKIEGLPRDTSPRAFPLYTHEDLSRIITVPHSYSLPQEPVNCYWITFSWRHLEEI